ncbi:MAG: EAL domain-containing protein [Lachnospiraceae bacterium]|nr:EAL domain-containing protein [Lachnospiraceae bacterium]
MNINTEVFDIISSVPDGHLIFIENIESGESNWSKEVVEYLGLPECRLGNTKDILKDITHSDDKERLLQEYEAVFSKEKEAFYLSFRIRNFKGEYIPCICKGNVIFDEDGTPGIFTGAITVHKGEEEYDAITDLPKIQSFLLHISQIKKINKECLLMALKLKHFNDINTLYGYDFGNKTLYEVAKIIRNIIGASGAVYRLENTGFGIVFNESDLNRLKECYSQIKNALANYSLDGFALNIEIRSGALYTKNYEVSRRMIYSYLISALEKAKENDDNKLVIFDDASHENNHKTLELLDVIKASIRNNCEGFYLCYQPFISTVTGKIIGAEALIRWKNPIYGEVSPGRFVPYLESHSCFYDLSIWILRRAMKDVKEIIKNYPRFFINVNMSYSQLERPEFVQEVIDIAKEIGFPTRNLQLELTERCRNIDMKYLKEQLNFLREHDIKIALDDYGTGNSTINLLCELPITSVKIDQTFILNILNKGSNQVVVDSTVQCAKRLGLTVCLEGVETQEIKDFIGKYSANYHQGYFYSRPIEFSKFKSIIMETWPVNRVSLIKENPNDELGVDSILSMMPGGFFIYADDEKEKILSVNEMLLDIFECDSVDEFLELTNGSFKGIVHPEDYQEVRKSIYEQISVSHNKMDYVRYRIITKTGKIKYVHDYGHLVHRDSDVDLFYVFVVEEML